jgi:hypothetical protein
MCSPELGSRHSSDELIAWQQNPTQQSGAYQVLRCGFGMKYVLDRTGRMILDGGMDFVL